MLDAEPVQRSFLSFIFRSLGWHYGPLLLVAGVLCFIFAMIIVIRGNGPMAAAALVLVVHVPFLIGILATTQGAIMTYDRIAVSAASPSPAEVADGISTSLVGLYAGITLTTPGYLAAMIGAFIRSVRATGESAKP